MIINTRVHYTIYYKNNIDNRLSRFVVSNRCSGYNFGVVLASFQGIHKI